MSKDDLVQLSRDCLRLQEEKRTLLLATQGEHQPDISYAPYYRDAEGFWIFISELAGHCGNLLRHPRASVMFITDERDSNNLFARERLTFRCRVETVPRDDMRYEPVLQQMTAVHGNMLEMLRTLPDFRLFCLRPQEGTYVVGFGRAYQVNPDGSLEHIDENRLRQRRGTESGEGA